MKNTEYRYQAVNNQGATVEGSIYAENEQDAFTQLRTQTLTPLTLKVATGPSTKSRRQRITHIEKILLIRELATLLRAGITLADAIESLASARDGTALGVGLQRCYRTLNAGGTFVTALADANLALPIYVNQLAATGELTGKLGAALADAARQMEYDERTRQDLKNALTYPIILILAGLAAILLVLLFVVPKFANLIKNRSSVEIPEISLWVINSGVYLKTHWLWFLIGALALLMSLALTLRDPTGRTRWLARLSKLPVLGEWLTQAESGRWATTLGTLLGNRVPILAALELAAQSLRFPHLQRSMQFVIRDVKGGATLADTVAKYGLVNATGVNLIRVGEKSGELPQMVATLGELQTESGRNRMKRFLLLLEPVAILVIGGIIGFLMVAVMLAITSINTAKL